MALWLTIETTMVYLYTYIDLNPKLIVYWNFNYIESQKRHGVTVVDTQKQIKLLESLVYVT